MKISRIGPIVVLDDEDVEAHCVDHFLAAQVRSVTTEWDKDGDLFVEIAFLNGGDSLGWYGASSREIALAVWPELKPGCAAGKP